MRNKAVSNSKLKTIYARLFLVFGTCMIILSCKSEIQGKFKAYNNEMDSISTWVEKSRDVSLDRNERLEFLSIAFDQSSRIKNDSLKKKALLKIANVSFRLGDSISFKIINNAAREACVRAKDTFGIADTHWNLAAFYANRFVLDSAYFHYHKAQEKFHSINNSYNSARMLYNMAVIQKDIKNYTGSEILIFQAIKKFEGLDRSLNLYMCYNILGILFNEIKEYNKAIYNHEKALLYLDDVEDKRTYKEGSFNNLGLVYQRLNNYDKSIYYFRKALKNHNIKNVNINLYARLLDNMAYSKLLRKDNIDLYPLFFKAFSIRDSIGNNFDLSISKFHLSKYFLFIGDTANAIQFAKESNKLATEVKNNKVILKSLRLLAELDHKNSDQYFEKYIDLNNILLDQERQERNKFTRIRFETDEYIQKTERLDDERRMLVAGSIVVVLIISLLFLIKIQSGKNRVLLFEKKQQKTNEEIYSLMLRQQVKLEESKINERNRIAEDLHDGVLGRIFGARMGLGFLRIRGNEKTLKKHKSFIEELQKIEKDIRDISHELRTEYFSTEFNFVILVEDLLKNQSEIGRFEYVLEFDDRITWKSIDENVKINCYRILQEAIYNVNKHSKASKLRVQFKIVGNVLEVLIQDNGSGFNLRKKRKGIGLKNVQMRAKKINAKFVIKSLLNKGTTLILSIPIK